MSQIQFPANWRGMTCVLIDDDALMRTAWAYRAKHVGVTFHAFEGVQKFLDSDLPEQLSPGAWIFVDSQLGEDLPSGEVAARAIYELGFRNLCLATGYEPAAIGAPEWIVRTIGKEPPF